MENIIDIGLENSKTQPKRERKKPLQVVFAKSEKLVLPKPDFLVNWEFDPAQVLLEDRKLRNDFFYLDTSAVIRWILQSPNHYTEFGKWDSAISSTLLKLEFTRAIDRLQNRIS